MKITEKELLSSDSARAAMIEKIIQEAFTDIDSFMTKYHDAIVRIVSENASDQAEIDRLLRRLSSESSQSFTVVVASKFEKLTTAERTYFETLGVIDDIALSDKQEIFARFVNDLETGFLDLSNKNRLELRREIRTAIGQDLSLKNLVENLELKTDKLSAYAKTIGQSSMSQVSQDYNNVSASNAGLTHALYAGTTTARTRPFCLERVGKVYSIDQIKDMSNGQLEPVITHRGGYNCTHRWVWVNLDWDKRFRDKLG